MTSGHNRRKYLLPLLFGFAAGCALIFISAVVFYRISGHELQGKIRYYFQKGNEKLKAHSQNKLNVVKQVIIPDVWTAPEAVDLRFDVDISESIRPISPFIYGSNLQSKTEFEMDVAKFAKDVGITNVRFPGGGSMGYRWKLATYDFNDRFDEAPLSKIENIIKFCQIMGAKLVVQVNVESGTPEEAADWVRYMNIDPGASRVDYWELGNEVYGDWDEGHMSGEDYVKVIKAFSVAMKQVDPSIKIGADWGGERYQAFDEAIMKGAADYIDFVSFHWYPNHTHPRKKYKGRSHPYPEEVMANGLAVGKLVERFENMITQYTPHRKEKIEFTVMEWDGSWDAVPSDLEFQYRGITWSLANAIFHAEALAQFALHGVTVANQYTLQEVMHGFIRGWDRQAGWGGSRWDGETVRPKALALKLFARYFEDILIESSLTGSPSYYKEPDWRPDSYTGQVPYVTGYASKSSQGDVVAIALINKHGEKDFKVNISIEGASLENKGEVWILSGTGLSAQNDGSPGVVGINKYDLSGIQNKFKYNVPARSVNLLRIPLEDINE